VALVASDGLNTNTRIAEQSTRNGWKYRGTIGGGNPNRFAFDNVALGGTFRQNNDGPGWTLNRTTTVPDTFRPIPFKAAVAAVSFVASLARRDLLGRR